MSEPSQFEANKMLRVLNGTRLKYTVHVYHANGQRTEWQTDYSPDLHWDDNLRCYMIKEKASKEGYDTYDVMKWTEGDIIRVEENDPPKKP